MDRFKRVIFPALVLIIIIIALFYRLSSCVPKTGVAGASDTGSQASPSEAVTASPDVSASPKLPSPSPSPKLNYRDDDIVRLFDKEGMEVKEIRDAGLFAAVAFQSIKAVGDVPVSFAWFDRTAGGYEVACGRLLVDKFNVTAERTLTILTTGKDYVNGKQWFPELVRSYYSDGAGSPRYTTETYPYFMPITRSFTVSDDRRESIRSLVLDYDAVSVGFVPQKGHEGEFEVAYRYIPKTGVVCSAGFCYVTFYNTTLAEDFKAPEKGDGDGLRTFVSITSDGTNTLLTLKLGPQTARYNLSMAYSPDDGMPYAVLKFRTENGVAYPAGW